MRCNKRERDRGGTDPQLSPPIHVSFRPASPCRELESLPPFLESRGAAADFAQKQKSRVSRTAPPTNIRRRAGEPLPPRSQCKSRPHLCGNKSCHPSPQVQVCEQRSRASAGNPQSYPHLRRAKTSQQMTMPMSTSQNLPRCRGGQRQGLPMESDAEGRLQHCGDAQ